MSAFNDAMAALNPLIDWRFDQTGGISDTALINYGSLSAVDYTLPANLFALTYELTGGDQGDGGSKAIKMDVQRSGFSDSFSAGDLAGDFGSTGSVVFVFKLPAASSYPGVANRLWTFNGAGGFNFFHWAGGEVSFDTTGASGWSADIETKFIDGNFHVGVIVQDGVAGVLYVDGEKQITSIAGDGTWWLDTFDQAWENLAIGFSTVNYVDAEMDRFVVTDTVLSWVDAQRLHEEYRLGEWGTDNTYYETVFSLATPPTHFWPLNEMYGGGTNVTDYLDVGTAATPSWNLSNFANREMQRQAPSTMIRGRPNVYGMATQQDSQTSPISNAVVDGDTILTGAFKLWLYPIDLTITTYPLSVVWLNNTGFGLWFSVSAAGVLTFRITDGVTDWTQIATAAGAIEAGLPYMIAVIQRADGNGFQLFINGVNVGGTRTQNGTADIDTFIDGIIGAGAGNGELTINGRNGAIDTGTMIVAAPAFWQNEYPSDPDIANLYAAGVPNEAVPIIGSFEDFVMYYLHDDVERQADLVHLVPVWNYSTTGAGFVSELATARDAPANDYYQAGGFVVADINVADVGGMSSDFDLRKVEYFDGGDLITASIAGTTGYIGTETEGTVTFGLLINAAGLDTRTFWSYGISLAGNNELRLSCVSTAAPLSFKIRFEAWVGSVKVYDTLSDELGVDFSTAPDNERLLCTFVQTGTGVELYVNGASINLNPTVTTDPGVWINDIAAGSSSVWIGGVVGSASTNSLEPNDINVIMETRKVLTPAQIGEMWDAYNGIFPQPPPGDEEGDFVAVIDTTGNNGTGPDHWWRMNEADGSQLEDSGVNVIDGKTITIGGDPDYEVTGPMPRDASNEAIFFDGQGDYFEVGLDLVTGQLEATAIGTAAFFFSAKLYDKDNWAYSQANDLGTAFWNFGVSNNLVQLSADDGALTYTLTSSIPIVNYDFIFAVVTSDGDLYINGSLDTSSIAVGILQWWDEITATRTAIAATADQNFTTETIGRFSEILLWEEVLTAAQIAAIWAAIQADGIAGLANVLSVLTFENVTFRNGGEADVRVENTQAEFTQVVQVDQSRFIGGVEGGQGVLLKGANIAAQIDGNEFDLEATPTTGREAIRATTADPTVAPTVYSSLIATDNTLKGMGTVAGAAIFLESGFGATIDKNRIRESLGAGIGWRGDAERVLVRRNQVEGVSSAVAGICAKQGLNTAGGQNWQVRGNIVLDVTDGNGIRIEGKNSNGLAFAPGVQVTGNVVGRSLQPIFIDGVRESAIMGNELDGGTEGIRIGELLGSNLVRRNVITGHSAEGIIMAEAAAQVATLILDRNTINGNLSADGVLVSGVDTLVMNANKILSTVNAMQIGNIATRVLISRNQIEATTTVLFLIGSTTQNGMQIFGNIMPSLGDAEALTVAANAVEVTGNYHTLTSVGAVDLNTIGGQTREGAAMILRLAAGSADITAKDGADDMELAGDFIFDQTGESQLWLVEKGGTWYELSRANGT